MKIHIQSEAIYYYVPYIKIDNPLNQNSQNSSAYNKVNLPSRSFISGGYLLQDGIAGLIIEAKNNFTIYIQEIEQAFYIVHVRVNTTEKFAVKVIQRIIAA